MPHSSSGYGEVYVDRTYLIEMEGAKATNEKKLDLEGQESSPPATVALCRFLHDQISSFQIGKLVPVTFRDKAELDGYYLLGNSNAEMLNYQNEVVTVNWTLEMERLGHHTEVDIQSRLVGATRQNDHSRSGVRWHSPSIGHYSYHTGGTFPTVHTRATENGTQTVYLSVPAEHPRWGCTPANYGVGRVKIKDTSLSHEENEIEGITHKIGAKTWSMSNGIMNISPVASATNGDIDYSCWNGSSYTTNRWRFRLNSVDTGDWQSATVLRNDFEMCVVRLVSATSSGRFQLDLTLRRGARFVEYCAQTSSSATMQIISFTTGTFTTSTSGIIFETSGTVRRVAGCARTVTPGATGNLAKSSTRIMEGFVGFTPASPVSGDAAADLFDQYLGCMPEITYAVRR